MSKVNVLRELERELKEVSDILAEELEGIEVPQTEENLKMDYRKKITICDKLREIYMAAEDNEEIKMYTIQATIMAKKMVKRLIEYRKTKELLDIVEPGGAVDEWRGHTREEKEDVEC